MTTNKLLDLYPSRRYDSVTHSPSIPPSFVRMVGLFLISILLIACQPIIDTRLAEDASTVDEENGLVGFGGQCTIVPDGNVAGAPN